MDEYLCNYLAPSQKIPIVYSEFTKYTAVTQGVVWGWVPPRAWSMQSGDWGRTGVQLFSQELQLTLKTGHLVLLSKVYILGGWSGGLQSIWSLLFISFLCDVTCKRRKGKFRMLSLVELSTQLRRHSHACRCLLFPYNLRKKALYIIHLDFSSACKHSFKLHKTLYSTCTHGLQPLLTRFGSDGVQNWSVQSYSHLQGGNLPDLHSAH